jgi:hypothetical protein
MTPQAHRGRYLPPNEPPREPLARLLLGAAGLVALAVFFLVLLPGLAS